MFAMHRTNRFSDYMQSSSDTAWTWRKRRQQQAQRTNVLSPHDLCHGSSSLVCSAERHSPRTTARIKKHQPKQNPQVTKYALTLTDEPRSVMEVFHCYTANSNIFSLIKFPVQAV